MMKNVAKCKCGRVVIVESDKIMTASELKKVNCSKCEGQS